jgi:hypothetical protein
MFPYFRSDNVQSIRFHLCLGCRGGMMNLNLQILKTDLSDIVLAAHILDRPLERRLAFPVIYNGEEQPSDDRLYLTNASDLPLTIDLAWRPSFLCIGTPADRYVRDECNILILAEDLSIKNLLARTSELFHFYNTWELEMRQANIRNLPLTALGELAEPVFGNPVALHDRSLKYIFHIVNPDKYSLPDNYRVYKENAYMELDDVNTLKYEDNELIKAAVKKEPAIYPGENYGYRSLYTNIFLSGKYVARLLVDEISRKFTDRDMALITVLGEAVKESLQLKNILNQWYPRGLDEILVRLLEHQFVDEDELKSVLAENGWALQDTYVCLSIVPSELDTAGKTLFSLMDRLSALVPGNCRCLHNDTIICLFNLSAVKLDREAVRARMLPYLRDSFLKAGMSAAFCDFKNIYYCYQQSLIALRLGEKHRQDYWYYDFDDYALDYIIENSKPALGPESFCPEGLLRLLRYDREEGTDYMKILRVYLENNMSAVQTQKILYMHCNTFYFKLNRIREILDMNLEEFNIRLRLVMAFRFLDS